MTNIKSANKKERIMEKKVMPHIDEISNEEIVDYLKTDLEMSGHSINRQMKLFKRNQDIFDEFKYWFCNFKNGKGYNFVVEHPVEVQGYTADILARKFGAKNGIEIYNLLIALREDPEETFDLITKGFICQKDKKEFMKNIEPYVAIKIINREPKIYESLEIISNNAYSECKHFKINGNEFLKILDRHRQSVIDCCNAGFSKKGKRGPCYIRITVENKLYGFDFDYENKELLDFANVLYQDFKNVIDHYRLDYNYVAWEIIKEIKALPLKTKFVIDDYYKKYGIIESHDKNSLYREIKDYIKDFVEVRKNHLNPPYLCSAMRIDKKPTVEKSTEEDKWYKKNENDEVWWLDNKDAEDKYVFSFDKKTKFNIYKDYPFALTTEQKAIFDRENPKWRDFLKEKR